MRAPLKTALASWAPSINIIIIIISSSNSSIIIIIMRMRPRLYREKFSRGHPPSPSQLKQMFIWETVDPFTRAENTARACSDSLALTELMTRLGKSSVYLEKSWLS